MDYSIKIDPGYISEKINQLAALISQCEGLKSSCETDILSVLSTGGGASQGDTAEVTAAIGTTLSDAIGQLGLLMERTHDFLAMAIGEATWADNQTATQLKGPSPWAYIE
ncbi:MAG: hypothetical protein LBG68_00895 [Coriobacteriales bacterium]|nr:hypothetical protein [Coriobacteriales bacterium]